MYYTKELSTVQVRLDTNSLYIYRLANYDNVFEKFEFQMWPFLTIRKAFERNDDPAHRAYRKLTIVDERSDREPTPTFFCPKEQKRNNCFPLPNRSKTICLTESRLFASLFRFRYIVYHARGAASKLPQLTIEYFFFFILF